MGLGGALEAMVAVKAIDAAVTEAGDVPWNCVDPDELADAVARLEVAAVRVAALRARVLAEAEQSPVAARHGFRALDQYVAARTGHDPADVRAELRIGRWLRSFPLFDDAYQSGKLSRGHVEWMRRSHRQRFHHHLVDAQQHLIDAATGLDWIDWLSVWGYFLIGADPDGAAPKEHLANRRCSIRTRPDGSVSGSFLLDPVSGHAATKAVAAEEQRLLDLDAQHGIARSGSDRRADALVRVLMRGATRESGDLPAPLVHVTIGQELAQDMIRAATEPDGHRTVLDAQHGDLNRRCELADGTPLHPHLAMAVLAVTESVVLDLGDSTRSFPNDIKLAILVAARGRCRTPGCDAPYAWLQADHIHPWIRHGPTATRNGQSLCRPDNRHKRDR